ncbi:MAG: universal stress protein [Alphaproteobacteria bacterium]
MAEETGASQDARARVRNRVFLCVVDETEELHVALEFAALRAKRLPNTRVGIAYVIDAPADFQHWAAVGDLMREEARDEAEQKLLRAATQVHRWSGKIPVVYVREGAVLDELFELIQEDHDVALLILGADVGPQGPGPLVSSLTGKQIGRLRVPLVIVPGNLSDEELESLA